MDVITATALTKRYGATQRSTRSISPSLRRRPSGCSAATARQDPPRSRWLLGLLIPTAGSIFILGHDMARDRFAALAKMNFHRHTLRCPRG